jgi:hypothetical protein
MSALPAELKGPRPRRSHSALPTLITPLLSNALEWKPLPAKGIPHRPSRSVHHHHHHHQIRPVHDSHNLSRSRVLHSHSQHTADMGSPSENATTELSKKTGKLKEHGPYSHPSGHMGRDAPLDAGTKADDNDKNYDDDDGHDDNYDDDDERIALWAIQSARERQRAEARER